MAMIQIHHKGLGATAEIDEVSLPEWVEVGWAKVAPTSAERAAESAPPRAKKKTAAPTTTESE